MGRTEVEILLFGNEAIKFNDNLDLCDEKMGKKFRVKFEALREKKMLTWKKVQILRDQKNAEHIFAEISTIFFESAAVKGLIEQVQKYHRSRIKSS